MDGSEYNNLLRYLAKKEYNEKLTANVNRQAHSFPYAKNQLLAHHLGNFFCLH
jgi:hypothetical protein